MQATNCVSNGAKFARGQRVRRAARRIYVGNFGPPYCGGPPIWGLYGYARNNNLIEYYDQFTTTVGGVIIENTETYYHLDTCSQIISSFKWDPISGHLCKRSSIIVCNNGKLCKINVFE